MINKIVTKLFKYALVKQDMREAKFYLIETSDRLSDLVESLKNQISVALDKGDDDSYLELTIVDTTEVKIEPKLNEVFVLVSCSRVSSGELNLSDFIMYDGTNYYHVQEGTGDNLTDEDIEDGYVDYIYYDTIYEPTDESSITDGGLVLLEILYRELTLEQIVNRVIGLTHEC